jgi:hypothetical protein
MAVARGNPDGKRADVDSRRGGTAAIAGGEQDDRHGRDRYRGEHSDDDLACPALGRPWFGFGRLRRRNHALLAAVPRFLIRPV